MEQGINAIIVDDEKNGREVLVKLLEKRHPEVEVVGEATTVEEAFALCKKMKPHLVFLDIQMPRANGFNLLKMFDPVPFEVIFVTSFNQYAITAIKFNALDYLLKPIAIDELDVAVSKVIKNVTLKTNRQEQVINLIHSLDSQFVEKTIAVHSGEKVKIISTGDIVSLRGDGRYSHLTMKSGEIHTTSKTLKDFEDYFGDVSKFIRISKFQMINSVHITEYHKGEPFIIRMVTNETFEVARRKKPEVMTKLRTII